jgi:hypothetical protein
LGDLRELTFIVPIAMIYVFGEAFGIGRKASGPSGIPLAVVSESANPSAQKLSGKICHYHGPTSFRSLYAPQLNRTQPTVCLELMRKLQR